MKKYICTYIWDNWAPRFDVCVETTFRHFTHADPFDSRLQPAERQQSHKNKRNENRNNRKKNGKTEKGKSNWIKNIRSNRFVWTLELWTQHACGFIHLIYKRRHLNSLKNGHRFEMFCWPRCFFVGVIVGPNGVAHRFLWCVLIDEFFYCQNKFLCPIRICLCDDHDSHHDATKPKLINSTLRNSVCFVSAVALIVPIDIYERPKSCVRQTCFFFFTNAFHDAFPSFCYISSVPFALLRSSVVAHFYRIFISQ